MKRAWLAGLAWWAGCEVLGVVTGAPATISRLLLL